MNLFVKSVSGVPEYEKSDVVIDNLGKCHLLKIDGLLVTKQTISFRVDLNPEQLKLWNEEEQSHPTVPRGSRAHLTVATARGVPAKVAGDDILDLRTCLQYFDFSRVFEFFHLGCCHELSLSSFRRARNA